MTTIRDINIVKGSVFDLAHLMGLVADDCNLLLVSTRTLSIIQALGNDEVSFTVRYASEFLEGNRYIVADSSTDLDNINNIVNNYRLEVTDMSCEIVAALEAIAVATEATAQASCGACGSEVDPTSEATPPVGPGEPWSDLDEYDTYKCQGANWLLDGLTDLFQKLLVYDVDFWTATTVAAGSGLITSIILTTLLGGWVVLVAGAVIGLITALILGVTIDLTDIKNVLISDRADLICALYNGSDASSSTAAFSSALSTAGLNGAEVALVGLIMANSLVNNLYEFNAVIDAYTATTSCDTCGPEPCPYDLVYGTGTITYDQQPFVISSVVNGPYHEINLQSPASGSGCSAANWCMELTATTITNPEGGLSRTLWCWKTGASYGSVDWPGTFPPLDTEMSVASTQFISSTAFTVTMKINAKLGFCATDPEDGCP